MAHTVPVPCPVELGTLKNESLEARLHEYVRQGNYVKVKKLLKKGISVDTINSLGQTPLFTASLLGLGKLVDILLDYGSDPNHRCYDGSTPVHAAAFSGDQLLLSKLLDAGGDLRVHDKNGKNPQSWALTAGKEAGSQMLEFIQRCTVHMQAALQSSSFDLLRKVDSPRTLVGGQSKFGGITQGTAGSPLKRLLRSRTSPTPSIFSFGYGKFCLTARKQLGYLASLPVVAEKELVQADDEPTCSFQTGPYMVMTNLMWRGSPVTVKEMNTKPHQHCSKLRFSDLLLAEQEHSSKLRHPHLLQLMAVCLSLDLERTRLVFERVNFGSLYSILHEQRSEFLVMHLETVVHLLLQVSDALRFLHLSGFVHRTVSSYAVAIVLPGEAKLTNLEHMIESKDGGEHSDLTRVPIPPQLYNWCAPEVILEKAATTRSDIYSFCAVMQEVLTEAVPWGGLEGSRVRDRLVSGQLLEPDGSLPKLYYDIVKTGLEFRPKQRSMNLQDIRYLLKTDLKDLADARRNRPGENSGAPKADAPPEISIFLPPTSAASHQEPERQAEMAPEVRSFTASRCAASPSEPEDPGVGEAEPVVRMAESSLLLEAAAAARDDTDESLCSFEINEIYTCYPELCEEEEEEEEWAKAAGLDDRAEARRESQTVAGDTAQTPSPQPLETWNQQLNGEEEAFSSGPGAASSRESTCCAPESHLADPAVREAAPRGRIVHSSFEQTFGKCVLTMTICQKKLREVMESLCRTERILDEAEAGTQLRQPLLGTPEEPPRLSPPLRDRSGKVGGGRAILWKAVGPPTLNYIPPPLRVPGTYQPLAFPSFQATRNESKNNSQSQGAPGWSHARPEACRRPENTGAEPNYQLLHPGVSVRRRKYPVAQSRQGSPTGDEGFSSKSAPEVYERGLRSEERRMVQAEWTMEVKHMAKKTASGQLRFPPPCQPGEWTSSSSESETDGGPAEEPSGLSQSDSEAGSQPERGPEEVRQLTSGGEGESDPGMEPMRFRGSQSQRKSIPRFATEVTLTGHGVTSHKSVSLSATTEDLCTGQKREDLVHSPLSSLNESEEFLTPDSEFFLGSSAPHDLSRQESLTVGEDLEVTQSLWGPEEHLETSQGGRGEKERPLGALKGWERIPQEGEVRAHRPEGPEQDALTTDASTGTRQSTQPATALGDFKEEDEAPVDIQDLSSISYEDSFKLPAPKTPRNPHSPTGASTPISPDSIFSAAPSPRFSSTVTKNKEYCMMTVGAPAAREKEKTVDCSSPGKTQPGFCSKLSIHLTRQKESGQEPGNTILSTEQADLEKAGPKEEGDSEEEDRDEIALNKCRADFSLWITEASSCPGDETERAHSSLDNILEGVLGPVADSQELHEKLPDPIQRQQSYADLRNIEMKGGAEESFSESEGSAEGAEGLL